MNLESATFFPAFLGVAFWVGISFVLSLIGGWLELARAYRASRTFEGQTWKFQSATFRLMVGYNNILTIGANSEGLHLSVFFLFRAGHPPLFIPLQDISVRPTKFLWVRQYEFSFCQVPSVRLRLRENVGQKIQAVAGPSWPGDRATAGAAF